MQLLLIEDDQDIARALSHALSAVYRVEAVPNGQDGLAKVAAGTYDLIVLDLNLPDMTGLEVCKQLRQRGCSTPILILTGNTQVLNKINLLDAGADDYLTKPFSLGELKVRLRVLLRRAAAGAPPPTHLIVDDLVLNSDSHYAERAGQPLKLRRKEFALLECLMHRAGTVVTRQTLCSYAWRDSEDPWTNTVDVHIKYLRDKVDRPFEKPLIKTIHGLGYKLETPRHNTPKESQ